MASIVAECSAPLHDALSAQQTALANEATVRARCDAVTWQR
jgi:hypothetical protein